TAGLVRRLGGGMAERAEHEKDNRRAKSLRIQEKAAACAADQQKRDKMRKRYGTMRSCQCFNYPRIYFPLIALML
ncbi:MAG: hypothetical protein C4293_13065, partial [Nitrospiraceae bacterium]